MAAVAGMDASDATDAMTSALRGFNMELSDNLNILHFHRENTND